MVQVTIAKPKGFLTKPPRAGTSIPEPSGASNWPSCTPALAHVAATAQASDGREWIEVAGPWFSDITLALYEQDRT